MKRHFEDWRLVFLRWLNIFVMQFTSDCQRRKKKTGKSIFNLSWKTWSLSLIASTLLTFFTLLSIQEDHWKEGRQKILGSTFLWLKFLVLISFPCFAGLFDLPKLDTKEHDHLKYKTRDKYQSWNEGKIGSTPIQRIKWKIGVWSIRHPPPHPPPLDRT